MTSNELKYLFHSNRVNSNENKTAKEAQIPSVHQTNDSELADKEMKQKRKQTSNSLPCMEKEFPILEYQIELPQIN